MVDFVGTSYTVMEGDTTLDIDIRLTAGSIERAFPSSVEVEFTTLDITTEGKRTCSYIVIALGKYLVWL